MKKGHRELTNREISQICMELSLLVHSGVSVGGGLDLLAQEEKEPRLAALLRKLGEEVDMGAPLAQAMEASGVFPSYVGGLVEVGERSGRLEQALSALSQYYLRREQLNRQIRSSLTYPAVLLVLMLAVIGVLLVRVLPVFNDVYTSLGGELTGVAGGLLSLGRGLSAALPVLCVILAIIVVVGLALAVSPSFRGRVLAWWRVRMGDRGITKRLNTARFAQALSMGMMSGLPVEESIELAASFQADIPAAHRRHQDCLDRLERGESLSQALGESGVFPAASCRMLALGVQGGMGDTVMEELAQRLSQDGEHALENLVAKVEPTLVILTSLMVGVILLSVMLPLMDIMAAIG